jgi:hypothetical protein
MKLKLLEVLRNNDTSKLLDLIKQIDNNNNNNNNNNQSNYDLIKLKNELLLFAVQVGPLSIVKYIIENNLIDDINSQDLDGNTALHLAAISNRNDIVEYLMKNPNINDCLYNKDLKQPIQCTTNIETAQLMDFLRTKHIEKIASQLRNGFETRNFELLDQLLSNPRDKELLDINGTDPITTDTVLIEFIKKNDYEMVKFILNHGGDPFKRSLSGKSPEESTNDIKMKQIIEDSFSQQNIIESTTNHPQDGSPTYKGFLKKWTNFAGGYKLRWFVLDHQAILSYYKSPNDMNNTCRGLIHLAHAMLKVDSSENTKFEIIIQNPSDGSPVRWHLKANHATEAQKWIWILQNAIRFAKDFEKKQRKSIVLSHILNEDLPQSSPYNNNNNNNNHPHQQQQLHSPLDHHPATIPESDVLSNDMIIQENEDRKPTVESIISDANEASNDFKQLIKITDSESDLPLKNNLDNNNTNNNNNNNVNVNVNANEIYDNINNTNTNDQNTNTSLSDSLRNQIGPVPDRRSQYSGSGSSKLDSYNHNRAISVSSFTSNKSNNSDVSASKSSFTKKLYKKPLKQLSKIGKKTRQSFVVQNQSQPNSLAPINSAASFNSNASSALSSPDSHLNNGFGNNFIENNNNNNLEEVIDDENDDDDDEEEEEEGEEEENSSKKIVTTDLNVVRNQMTIQLKTFKDFLKSASIDDTISKNDLVEMSISILNTLDILINQEGDCVNIKYNELIRRLDKQQKISSIWENSIKQLEIEIHQRESKIVELEDKLKAVKKSLRNSVNHLHSSHLYTSAENVPTILPVEKDQQSGNATSAAALARQALTANLNRKSVIPPIPTSQPPFEEIEQQKEENHALQQQKEIQQKYQVHEALKTEVPIYPPPPVPFDPTLTEFLEESDDSDDEFFDAEESDEVKDMAVLERRETLKALKRRQSKIEKQNGEVVIPPPIPSEMPPPIPSLQVELNVPTIKTPENIYYNEPLEEEESSLQKSQTLIVNEPEKFEQTDISNEELPEANFKPHIDKYGRYVVNKHELMSESQTIRYGKILKEHSFEGYEDPLRLSLAPEDNRPKISLWGVLKSLVGKDMTKMTLPVSFNEPTSLLQRNVEVIEYSDLLDKASAIDNSTLRLVYVATFAASEYASTVGRIAKPFNPLLGETFEYTRSDKGYRCFVEQVSHHPPISALIAESPSWSYYGESNVKTKFLGRSFDIKHLGTWFCEVFPDAGVQCKNGKVSEKEVYSWKKVNNSVIGIIVGNPTIDNYGSMEIQNHMTGDYMKFEFKPRGWRASSAYEVKGEVFNAKGKLMYYVGGHWNSKIFCKPADDKNAERFLIWEAAPRQEMMFHLTNFAATLNAPLPHLLPKVACTDTRLRPDQRAMEDGDYDLAAAEKNRVEEKQREARRQREMKGETYEPTFFTRDNHPITGEEFWKYKGSYWSDRKAGKLINYKDIF